MTRKPLQIGVGGLMLALAIFMNGCASDVDDPSESDTVLRVDSISPSPVVATSVTITDELVTALVSATSRGTAGGSHLNDVILDNYTVICDPPLNGTKPALNFAISQVVISGGSASLSVVAVPAGMKPLVPECQRHAARERTRFPRQSDPADGRFTILLN
jgi:hypothetical protein